METQRWYTEQDVKDALADERTTHLMDLAEQGANLHAVIMHVTAHVAAKIAALSVDDADSFESYVYYLTLRFDEETDEEVLLDPNASREDRMIALTAMFTDAGVYSYADWVNLQVEIAAELEGERRAETRRDVAYYGGL